MGLNFLGQGMYPEAINCYDKALTIEPSIAGFWNNKGNAFDNMGRYQEAIACFDKAIELDPNITHIWNNKGRALSNLGKFQEAIACFDKAIELDPNIIDGWKNKGTTLTAFQGKHHEALYYLDKAIEIDSNDSSSWNNKGFALLNLSRLEEAIACFDKAIELDPNNSLAYSNKDEAYSLLGKSKGGKTHHSSIKANGFPPQIISLLQKYEIDVSKQVTFDIVKKKRKYWLELLHPDKNSNKSEETRMMAEQKLKEMNDVYRQLKEYFKNTSPK
jgi:tetratricopeptide (TPR) repeat protein